MSRLSLSMNGLFNLYVAQSSGDKALSVVSTENPILMAEPMPRMGISSRNSGRERINFYIVNLNVV